MKDLEKVEQMAEALRQETYHLFRNDCITKSRRLKRVCHQLGVPARQVVCFGYARAYILRRSPWVPAIHSWVEIDGRRIETSRPLGHSGFIGIVPMNIRPLIAIRF